MTEKPNNGGPAFPTEAAPVHPADALRFRQSMGLSMDEARRVLGRHPGMSLLDYYAGQAIVGLLSSPHTGIDSPENWAKVAYLIAEAMVREKESRS